MDNKSIFSKVAFTQSAPSNIICEPGFEFQLHPSGELYCSKIPICVCENGIVDDQNCQQDGSESCQACNEGYALLYMYKTRRYSCFENTCEAGYYPWLNSKSDYDSNNYYSSYNNYYSSYNNYYNSYNYYSSYNNYGSQNYANYDSSIYQESTSGSTNDSNFTSDEDYNNSISDLDQYFVSCSPFYCRCDYGQTGEQSLCLADYQQNCASCTRPFTLATNGTVTSCVNQCETGFEFNSSTQTCEPFTCGCANGTGVTNFQNETDVSQIFPLRIQSHEGFGSVYYPNYFRDSWRINVSNETQLRIVFFDFEIEYQEECSYDQFVIKSSDQFEVVCGSMENVKYLENITFTGPVDIYFHSDDIEPGYGFNFVVYDEASYAAYLADQQPFTQFSESDFPIEIVSHQEYGQIDYQPLTKRSWGIDYSGAMTIKLEYLDIETGSGPGVCDYDHLTIMYYTRHMKSNQTMIGDSNEYYFVENREVVCGGSSFDRRV